ncbi:MAG: hypothetical protein VST64_01550, partial [Nitrospirota bacterium]|nr:hypothetical protein [Nitrospirota bacterium]
RQFSFPRPVAGVGLESDRTAKTCVAIRGVEAKRLSRQVLASLLDSHRPLLLRLLFDSSPLSLSGRCT